MGLLSALRPQSDYEERKSYRTGPYSVKGKDYEDSLSVNFRFIGEAFQFAWHPCLWVNRVAEWTCPSQKKHQTSQK